MYLADCQDTDRRKMIKKAALELAYQNGYEGASVKLISEKAGVAVGLIYHHFKNKEELFKEALQEQMFFSVLEEIISGIYDLPVESALAQVSISFVGLLRQQGDRLIILLRESIHNPEFRAIFSDVVKRTRNILCKYFEAKVNSKELAGLDSDITVQMLINHFLATFFFKEILRIEYLPELNEEYIRESIRIFLSGWRKE